VANSHATCNWELFVRSQIGHTTIDKPTYGV
jgi:hypothetical protein